MKLVSVRDQYEDAELVAVLGEWVVFRIDEEEDPPTNYAVPARHVLEVEFDSAEEVDAFQRAYPMGIVAEATT